MTLKLKIDEGNVFDLTPDGMLLPEGDAPITAKEYHEVEIEPPYKNEGFVRVAFDDLMANNLDDLVSEITVIANGRRKADRRLSLELVTGRIEQMKKTIEELKKAIDLLEGEVIKVPVELVAD